MIKNNLIWEDLKNQGKLYLAEYKTYFQYRIWISKKSDTEFDTSVLIFTNVSFSKHDKRRHRKLFQGSIEKCKEYAEEHLAFGFRIQD